MSNTDTCPASKLLSVSSIMDYRDEFFANLSAEERELTHSVNIETPLGMFAMLRDGGLQRGGIFH
tara:strand:+ start:505 stop:699 length:195 start_codon:yes stop_codon:yes gene_type:complete